ncbi:MAG: phytanoyl-CoA dioxygenase family protein [Candidatus Azotimanducaceae bacterium]|uniref:Phytanoyl-CoA dioxygenase family protein n=1 Tax=OM182 bacterium TaxID=2510334 RepID=A0A520RY29_9GAMM|nr:MAG: hypothetical protein EVA68_07665 [OM182 bacterium]
MLRNEFQEGAIAFERSSTLFFFLVAHNGSLLSCSDSGELTLTEEGNDGVLWIPSTVGFEHVQTGQIFSAVIEGGSCVLEQYGSGITFTITQGPEELPSIYLENLKRNGWVCLTSILSSYVVDRLQHTAATDGYEHLERRTDMPAICQDAAVGKTVCEPISLWLIREYLNTRDLHLAHPPNCISLPPYDSKRRAQGWHSDIPYVPYGRLDGACTIDAADRKGPIKAVQRNVCISDFRKENGATAYKLGSHNEDTGPPAEWNPAHEGVDPLARPYSGPEAHVIEAPAGSIVLYDARTWHRAGFNKTEYKRGAMLTSFQTADVTPKKDTRPTCAKLHASSVYQELNLREQQEITELMMNQPG